jgi:peptide/nickel transport system permease protein
MRRYIISRLLMVIPTVLGVSILVFSMMHLIPGDPVLAMLKTSPMLDKEAMRERLGLHLPVHVQYWNYISRAVRGDLGNAILMKRPIMQLIMENLPYTIRLAVVSWVIAHLSGTVLGIWSALTAGTWLDSVFTALAVAGRCLPGYWLAMMLIYVFAIRLDWLPIFAREESWKVLVMPAVVLGFSGSAITSRITRSGLLEVLGQDYIRTARAKGVGERAVVYKHALRNALMPVVTVAGLDLAGLMGGTVLIEQVFGRQGIGQLAYHAIMDRDYPTAQGVLLLVSLIYVVANVIMDLTYAYIDPRIRYQ